MARRPSIRLRPSLLIAFVVLLISTLATVGTLAYHQTHVAIDAMVKDHFDAVADATDSEVARLLAPAPQLVDDLYDLASYGQLDLEAPEDLAALIAERMQPFPRLAWLAVARPGQYTGGKRMPNGELRMYHADPAVTQWVVSRSGERTLVLEDAPDYRPDERPWFKAGLKANTVQWGEPYPFTSGGEGFSVVRGVDLPGGQRGVLVADYRLDDVTEFLHALRVGEHGHVGVATHDGTILGLDPALIPVGERALAQPLAAEVYHTADGVLWRATTRVMNIEGGLDWRVIILLPEEELTGVVTRNAQITAVGAVASLLLALLVASFMAGALTRPIRAIAAELEDIGSFTISDKPAPTSFLHEVGVMADALDHMKRGLRSFERYVPVSVVRQLLAAGTQAELGGEMRNITILFSDIAGFTTLAETTPPTVVVDALGEYFGGMSHTIDATDGVISAYIGDAIMALWGAPAPHTDHAARACRTALAMQRTSAELLGAFEARGLPAMATRIGVNTGDTIVGNIGAPNRFGYTGIGDAVNTAARLEGLNKVYGTQILIGQATVDQLNEPFVLRELDRVRLKGKGLPTTVYELVGEEGQVAEATVEGLAHYQRGLHAYYEGSFQRALGAFDQALAILGQDPASEVMRARCESYLDKPPNGEWDGVFVVTTK